jgi:hypothetical protein
VIRVPDDAAGGELTDALSGASFRRGGSIAVAELFEPMPFAVLVGEAQVPG